MIVKFDNGTILRVSEVNYAHTSANIDRIKLHIAFKNKEWLDIPYESQMQADNDLSKLMDAMKTDEK